MTFVFAIPPALAFFGFFFLLLLMAFSINHGHSCLSSRGCANCNCNILHGLGARLPHLPEDRPWPDHPTLSCLS